MKQTSQLKSLFDEAELIELKAAVAGDKILLWSIEKIIKDTMSELMAPTSASRFDSGSWALKKAYREGGAFHLQQLLNIFKEK